MVGNVHISVKKKTEENGRAKREFDSVHNLVQNTQKRAGKFRMYINITALVEFFFFCKTRTIYS